MEVKVGGPLRIRLFPRLLVTLADVHIRSRGTTLASASEANVRIGLLALLQNEIAMTKIELKHPTISIERDLDGTFNFQKPETPDATLPALNLAEISISDGTLLYADKRSGAGFEAQDCSGHVHHLRRSAGKRSDFMKDLSLTAEIACGQIPKHEFSVSELKFSVDGTSGVFDVEKVTMRLFGARGSASIHADYSGAVPRYHVRYDLPQFHIEEFFETRLSQKVAEGRIDFSLDLSMQGKTWRELSETAAGHFSLGSENLTLVGTDVDQEFSRYESSQNFNLADVGALFLAGPFGLVVTKGYNFASILQGSSGSTDIRTLVSEWKVERGMAQAQDVAMATKKNRIAVRGELDFVNEQFNDVTVALIDADGCAKVQQKIRGTFQEPVIEKPNFLEAVAGPAVELLEKGRQPSSRRRM